MPTARQLDELEESLRTFHNDKHAASGVPLERCTELKCLDARLSIAWLRISVRASDAQEKRAHLKTA